MSIENIPEHQIRQEDIDAAWQKSIESPTGYWEQLKTDEPKLAEELEIITGANATHNGLLDIEEKSRELRLASFVYGVLRNADERSTEENSASHEVFDESGQLLIEPPDGQ